MTMPKTKTLLMIVTAAMVALPATAALAVPMCDPTVYGFKDRFGNSLLTEDQAAQQIEMRLRSYGIDAHQSRFWNGCLQTFVNEGGHEVMKFYDPDTLREIPVN